MGMNRLFLLFVSVLCLCIGCGGGGGGGKTDSPPWRTVPSFTMSEANPTPLLVPSTVSGGHSTQELRCTVTSRGYWGTNAHIAFLLRYTPPPYPGLAGEGLAVGRTGVIGDDTGKVCHNITEPRPVVEVWAEGAGKQYAACPLNRGSILPPDTLGPVLADATPYPLVLQSIMREGRKFVRYTMAGYDSGEWQNPATGNDATQTGILVASSARTEHVPGWSVEFTECAERWSN